VIEPGVMTRYPGPTTAGRGDVYHAARRWYLTLVDPLLNPSPRPHLLRHSRRGTILGGCLQKGNWESQPDPSLALRINEAVCRPLSPVNQGKGIEALSVIRHVLV